MKFEDIKRLPPEFQPLAIELSLVTSKIVSVLERVDDVLAQVKKLNQGLTEIEQELDKQIMEVPV